MSLFIYLALFGGFHPASPSSRCWILDFFLLSFSILALNQSFTLLVILFLHLFFRPSCPFHLFQVVLLFFSFLQLTLMLWCCLLWAFTSVGCCRWLACAPWALGFYPRPVMAFGYCRCLCLSVCVYVRVCVRQSSVCPDDNLSPAQATITKFGPQVQNTLIKIPIVLRVHWPWPSRSNLT